MTSRSMKYFKGHLRFGIFHGEAKCGRQLAETLFGPFTAVPRTQQLLNKLLLQATSRARSLRAARLRAPRAPSRTAPPTSPPG